mmetsp:Transcript_15100/g.39229  ORF Transcript_15100/g.39229 Transcript_15100/m.39229 type:complete len:226 (-) Transcript_15100:114-791(-)
MACGRARHAPRDWLPLVALLCVHHIWRRDALARNAQDGGDRGHDAERSVQGCQIRALRPNQGDGVHSARRGLQAQGQGRHRRARRAHWQVGRRSHPAGHRDVYRLHSGGRARDRRTLQWGDLRMGVLCEQAQRALQGEAARARAGAAVSSACSPCPCRHPPRKCAGATVELRARGADAHVAKGRVHAHFTFVMPVPRVNRRGAFFGAAQREERRRQRRARRRHSV